MRTHFPSTINCAHYYRINPVYTEFLKWGLIGNHLCVSGVQMRREVSGKEFIKII